MVVISPPLSKHVRASLGRSVWLRQTLRLELLLHVTAKCKTHAFIWFFNAKGGIAPVDIHCQLTEVCGELVMDVKNVRKWCMKVSASCHRDENWVFHIITESEH